MVGTKICKETATNCKKCRGNHYKQISGDDFSECKTTCDLDKYKKTVVNDNTCEPCDSVNLFIDSLCYSKYILL